MINNEITFWGNENLKNNIFTFATKELSQDAFICWLLNFAHKEHKEEDYALAECAKEFLTHITGEKDPVVTLIVKQYKNIDILVVVNNSINIIIEDKTFSGTHDNQIERYKKILEQENRKEIRTVYYKIVEQAYKEENVDINIDRDYLLNLFKKYTCKTENQIFHDYYDHLKSIDADVKAYQTAQIEDWRVNYNHAYKGFFTHLIENGYINKEKNYNWSYVNNRAGGFWCLWWHGFTSEELDYCGLANYGISDLYLQIEDNIIVLKMTSKNSNSNDIRWKLYKYFLKRIPSFKKKTFRKGKYMSVGHIEYDEKNYIEKIKKMEKVMKTIINCRDCFIEK